MLRRLSLLSTSWVRSSPKRPTRAGRLSDTDASAPGTFPMRRSLICAHAARAVLALFLGRAQLLRRFFQRWHHGPHRTGRCPGEHLHRRLLGPSRRHRRALLTTLRRLAAPALRLRLARLRLWLACWPLLLRHPGSFHALGGWPMRARGTGQRFWASTVSTSCLLLPSRQVSAVNDHSTALRMGATTLGIHQGVRHPPQPITALTAALPAAQLGELVGQVVFRISSHCARPPVTCDPVCHGLL